jgi:hypothetical protein
LSVGRVTIKGMELTGRDFDKIPPHNLHVPVVDFARLWLAAEQRYNRDKTWASFGVVETCRWLAGATVRPDEGAWYRATAPVTERSASAIEELIEAECLAAEVLLFRTPVPTWVAKRPGWLSAVVATLAWAWRRSGTPPIDVHAHAQG